MAWSLVERVAAAGDRFVRPLRSPAARFRCAVGAGFALVAVGTASMATGGIGHADDLFSAFGSLFSAPTSQYSQSYSQGYRVDYEPRHRRQPRTARRHPGAPHSALKLAAAQSAGARKSVCVRLCDGFAFPVGNYGGDGDRAPHEATCQAECPGAQTALYLLPNGSDALGDAVEARTGQAYSRIPAAFRYATFRQESCFCHSGGRRSASLLHDFTLRRGDAVMTSTGVKVFHGGRLPYSPSDFVSLERSRDVDSGRRATFHAIERASFAAPARPAHPARPATASAAPLQKQASLAP